MLINLKVKTNSRNPSIEKISESEYKANLKSKPENNKANEELINLTKKYFKSEVKIIKGKRSSRKVLEIK
jgi:uncharacterized protein (TIGR00251 family)